MRVSSRVVWALLVAGVVPLSGCGSGKGAPDAGVDAGIDLEAYFGLQKGRCFEYTTAGTQQASPDLGVVVEGIDTVQFPGAWIVAYTTTSVVMRDYLAAKGNALMLYKREIYGGNTYIYDPPMQRLLAPLKAGSTQESSTQVTIRDGAGTVTANKETHDLRVDIFDPASLHLPIGTDVDASKINFAETVSKDGGSPVSAARAEIRSFIKGDGTRTATDGFVEINFNFNLNENLAPSDYKLQKVRDLGDDPTHASPPCGVAP